jgi:pimeloyl-ACP methyl ester carboxylesterase
MTDGLLLLHAFPLDASMWEAQITALGGDLIVVAPNFPGFGGAPLSGDVLSMDTAADVAADAVRSAGLQRVVVCGLSMGGYVALAYWRRHRDGVLGMLLANTRAGADDDAGKERRRALADRLEAEGNEFLATGPPPLLSDTAPPDLWERVKGVIRAQPAAAIAAASRGMAERPDSTPDLATIDVPTVVVTSTGDTLIPPEASTPMADQIPEAKLEVIGGAGHLSNLEAPDEFDRVLREHLARCGVVAR